jgi:hypothetical protein
MQPLQFVMDGSVVGRGCLALMLSVVYHGRALPLCWVVRGKKGHFPETMHQQLLSQIHSIMPPAATVIFLGDGEFDGTDLQADLRRVGGGYIFVHRLLMEHFASLHDRLPPEQKGVMR